MYVKTANFHIRWLYIKYCSVVVVEQQPHPALFTVAELFFLLP